MSACRTARPLPATWSSRRRRCHLPYLPTDTVHPCRDLNMRGAHHDLIALRVLCVVSCLLLPHIWLRQRLPGMPRDRRRPKPMLHVQQAQHAQHARAAWQAHLALPSLTTAWPCSCCAVVALNTIPMALCAFAVAFVCQHRRPFYLRHRELFVTAAQAAVVWTALYLGVCMHACCGDVSLCACCVHGRGDPSPTRTRLAGCRHAGQHQSVPRERRPPALPHVVALNQHLLLVAHVPAHRPTHFLLDRRVGAPDCAACGEEGATLSLPSWRTRGKQ